MTDNILISINETDEQFQIALENIKEDIKTEFLAITEKNRNGFFISLPRALKWLRIEYKDTKHFRDNFKRRILDSNNYYFREATSDIDYDADYIYKNNLDGDIRIKIPWFSDKGFKELCMIMSKSPKAKLIRKYYLDLEYDYIKLLKLEVNEIKIVQENTLKKLKIKQEEYSLLQKENIDMEKAYEKLNDKLLKYFIDNTYLINENNYLQNIKDVLYSNDIIDPEDSTNQLTINAYELLYGKAVQVILVSDKWLLELLMNEYNDITEDDFYQKYGLLQYNLESDLVFNLISPAWIKYNDDSQLFYFYFIKNKNYTIHQFCKLVTTLYFINEQHYFEFLNKLEDTKLIQNNLSKLNNYNNKFKNIIREIHIITYNDIINTHKNTATKIGFDLIYKKN
jgi:hypothetical protein